jgi:hypothetical protein
MGEDSGEGEWKEDKEQIRVLKPGEFDEEGNAGETVNPMLDNLSREEKIRLGTIQTYPNGMSAASEEKAAAKLLAVGGFGITDSAISSAKNRYYVKAGPYIIRTSDWGDVEVFYEPPIADLKTVKEARALWESTHLIPEWKVGLSPINLKLESFHFRENNSEHVFGIREVGFEDELKADGYALTEIIKDKAYLFQKRLPPYIKKHYGSRVSDDILLLRLDGCSVTCDNWSALPDMINVENLEKIIGIPKWRITKADMPETLECGPGATINLSKAQDRMIRKIAELSYQRSQEVLANFAQVQKDIEYICSADMQIIKDIEEYKASHKE